MYRKKIASSSSVSRILSTHVAAKDIIVQGTAFQLAGTDWNFIAARQTFYWSWETFNFTVFDEFFFFFFVHITYLHKKNLYIIYF